MILLDYIYYLNLSEYTATLEYNNLSLKDKCKIQDEIKLFRNIIAKIKTNGSNRENQIN